MLCFCFSLTPSFDSVYEAPTIAVPHPTPFVYKNAVLFLAFFRLCVLTCELITYKGLLTLPEIRLSCVESSP
jgi:hypothetical protein